MALIQTKSCSFIFSLRLARSSIILKDHNENKIKPVLAYFNFWNLKYISHIGLLIRFLLFIFIFIYPIKTRRQYITRKLITKSYIYNILNMVFEKPHVTICHNINVGWCNLAIALLIALWLIYTKTKVAKNYKG